jgi:hypothetical protein
MSTVVNVTLTDLVEKVVMDFVGSKRTFSAFDVTSEVRNRVNSGDYVIDGAKNLTFQNKQTQMIYHEEVKDIIYDIDFSQFNYVIESNGVYNVFKPSTVAPVITTVSTVVDESEDIEEDDEDECDGDCANCELNDKLDEEDDEYIGSDQEMYDKIDSYIMNKMDSEDSITLKQIQSRMKNYDLTLMDIECIVLDELEGYDIEYNDRGLSYSRVIFDGQKLD